MNQCEGKTVYWVAVQMFAICEKKSAGFQMVIFMNKYLYADVLRNKQKLLKKRTQHNKGILIFEIKKHTVINKKKFISENLLIRNKNQFFPSLVFSNRNTFSRE